MSKAVSTAPSAPSFDEQYLVGHNMPSPPPSYEQAMRHPEFIPLPGQPAIGPFQQQNYMCPGIPPPTVQQPVPPPPHPAPVIPPQITTVIVTGTMPMGPHPAKIRCPVCHMDIKTTTVSENKAGAHVACICLFLVG
ncbi:lipopolysaccharide-induced tumor necrosis factor-alpha factor homolog isoform X2 [Zootermopsis nevadensis]|nr:lipopolysaccharide-induced tumor necrosis factor-alpha factor homolog isoform X2 [Zootermopsis nevadensis]